MFNITCLLNVIYVLKYRCRSRIDQPKIALQIFIIGPPPGDQVQAGRSSRLSKKNDDADADDADADDAD